MSSVVVIGRRRRQPALNKKIGENSMSKCGGGRGNAVKTLKEALTGCGLCPWLWLSPVVVVHGCRLWSTLAVVAER